jgi:hypothetical protein
MIQDEDNRTERTFGDITQRKKYSHVDLIHMIGGMDAERGTVTAGGRGYYLMVSKHKLSFNFSLTYTAFRNFQIPFKALRYQL